MCGIKRPPATYWQQCCEKWSKALLSLANQTPRRLASGQAGSPKLSDCVKDSRGKLMISGGEIAINGGCYGFRLERGLSAAVTSAGSWVPSNPQHKPAHLRRGETATS